jgi:glucose/arabinose dehydrogenase
LCSRPTGKLFITLGERFTFETAQDLSNHLGKIVRINPDGTIPGDNPFVEKEHAMPEIWSYGHRHAQGAAINPKTGKLWESEFGPLAGLSSKAIVRLTLDGEKVTDEERIPMGTRIRDVVQGPDGTVYALTDEDNGKILKLTLAEKQGN